MAQPIEGNSTEINVPVPLVDIDEYLPESIRPDQNGIIPTKFMEKVYCGGWLCHDAARSWNAMVRAAFLDGIFISLGHPLNTYKNMLQQRLLFQRRFEVIDPNTPPPEGTVRVIFDNKTWQLKPKMEYVERPGTMSHGYGLAVFISNENEPPVREWLDKNAADFGFVRQFDFIAGRFVYIRSRQSIPARVLEIESVPEPKYEASQITGASGAKWNKAPAENWTCNGVFVGAPYRTGAIAVADQGSGVGLSEKVLNLLATQCAAILCTNATESLLKLNRPLLIASDIKGTVEKLQRFFEAPPPQVSTPDEDVERELKAELEFYRKAAPEATIYRRKEAMARRLLTISTEELKSAPEQEWYEEYLALLRIRIEDASLRKFSEKIRAELTDWYKAHSNTDERELAVLGLLQFIEATELEVPFNQHLWHATMIEDVRGVILDYFTRVGYADDDIATYYLARQSKQRHARRKLRVAFFVSSNGGSIDKMHPVLDALNCRDDVETMIIFYSENDRHHGNWENRIRKNYPHVEICDANACIDIRRMRPDYLFIQDPYDDERRILPENTVRNLMKCTKVCNISYGATLSHTFIDRLLADLSPIFYRYVYFFFSTCESVRKKVNEYFMTNITLGYQRAEFCGYPILDTSPPLMDEHSKPTILWTPRWSYYSNVGGSHFLEYKEKFVGLRQRYGDKVNLSIRPHKNTFGHLVKRGLATNEELEAYKQSLKDNDIKLYNTSFNLNENFRQTDILLGDYSSILIVFFLTGRPIVYCEFPNAVFFDEYQEMYKSMYIAHSWEDVERYLDDLIAGNDPLRERRQEAIKKIREMHANAVERIIECLLDDFKRSETPTEEVFE